MKSTRGSFVWQTLPTFLLCFVVALIMSISAQGQGPPPYAQGQPTVGSPPTSTAISSQMFLDATQWWGIMGNPTGGSCTTATQITGDMAGAIQAAICNLPANGGTVDARAFGNPLYYNQAALTLGSNPFADPSLAGNGTLTTAKQVTVLLPAGIIDVTAVIGIPRQSLLKGQGSLATILKIVTGFPGFTSSTNSEITNNCGAYGASGSGPHCFPVICMGLNGDSTSMNYAPLFVVTGVGNSCENPESMNPADGHLVNNPRVQVESLGIDLNPDPMNQTPTAYGVAIQNITAEEKSWVRNVQITDVGSGGRGINVAATGGQGSGMIGGSGGIGANEAQNSGPYTDLEINWSGTSGCTNTQFTALTYGVYVQNGPSVTVGSGGHITINGGKPCTAAGNNLIAVDASGAGVIVENLHAEKWFDAVRLGETVDTTGAKVANVTGTGELTNLVEVGVGGGSNHIVGDISSLYSYGTSGAPNFVFDNQTGCHEMTTCTLGATSGGGLASYRAGLGTDHTVWTQGREVHPSGDVDLAGNALDNEGAAACSPYHTGDLACFCSSSATDVGSCSTAAANLQAVGVLTAQAGTTPVYSAVGQATANSVSGTFTQGDYVCSDPAHAAQVVDNGTTVCPPSERFVGIAAANSSGGTVLVALEMGTPLPTTNLSSNVLYTDSMTTTVNSATTSAQTIKSHAYGGTGSLNTSNYVARITESGVFSCYTMAITGLNLYLQINGTNFEVNGSASTPELSACGSALNQQWSIVATCLTASTGTSGTLNCDVSWAVSTAVGHGLVTASGLNLTGTDSFGAAVQFSTASMSNTMSQSVLIFE